MKETLGEDAQEELKAIAGRMSKLRNEEQTNKPVIPISDDRPDAKVWNDYLREVTEKEGSAPSWFASPWLYVECYMYRRIQEAVELTTHLKSFDVFREQKEAYLHESRNAILVLLNYMMTFIDDLKEGKVNDMNLLFKEMVQVCLWGNKCDLSFSAGGADKSQQTCPLDQVNTLRDFVIIDDLDHVLSYLRCKGPGRVDIILDNAGFELVTDLCLAEFLLQTNLATSVHFHAKSFGWFVSDVTKSDFDFTFQWFAQSNSLAMNNFLQKWKQRLENGSWSFKVNDFWTLPFPYCEMKTYAADLYSDLSKSNLLIFKGDLNYRKLTSDLNWPTTTPFKKSLRGFHPAPLLSLRTLKADVVTGLQEGQAEEVEQKEKKWMVNGNWAVMSFCDTLLE